MLGCLVVLPGRNNPLHPQNPLEKVGGFAPLLFQWVLRSERGSFRLHKYAISGPDALLQQAKVLAITTVVAVGGSTVSSTRVMRDRVCPGPQHTGPGFKGIPKWFFGQVFLLEAWGNYQGQSNTGPKPVQNRPKPGQHMVMAHVFLVPRCAGLRPPKETPTPSDDRSCKETSSSTPKPH
jgi:hypothetical protein